MSVKEFVRRLSFKKSKSKSTTSGPTAAQWASTQSNGNDFLGPLSYSQPDVLNLPSSLQTAQSRPALPPSFVSFSPTAATPAPSSSRAFSPAAAVASVTPASPLSDWIYEDIVLERRGRGLGFTLAGGIDRLNEGDGSIYVTKILDGGVAASDGRLRSNDTILAVNGTSFVGLTHREAVNVLKATPNTVLLKVKRFLPASDNVSVIELYRPPGKGLGFMVAGGVGSQEFEGDDGIFVTRITEAGVADQDGRLAIGDRLLAVNDVSMTYVNHEEAVETLMLARGHVRLLVAKTNIDPQHFANAVSLATGLPSTLEDDYRPIASYNGNYATPQSQPDAIRSLVISTPSPLVDVSLQSVTSRSQPAPATTRIQSSPNVLQYQLPVQLQSTSIRSQAAQPLPELIPKIMTGSDIPSFIKEQRQIVIRKAFTVGLGFNVVGGVDGSGIFVSSIIPGGVADLNGQLRKGDQLLSVNNVDLREVTHQEATAALKAVGETAVIVVQYRPEEYNHLERKIREQQQKIRNKQTSEQGPLRSTLFIRALFDYDSEAELACGQIPGRCMNFCFGDILHVVNAGANDDWWQARKVLPWSDINDGSGIIPSKRRVETKPLSNRTALPTLESRMDNEPNRVNVPSKSRRRNFILSSKLPFGKSKEKLHIEGQVAQQIEITDSLWPPMSYEPVVQMQSKMTRPVIIFGPLKDRINDDLVSEFPDKFSSCVPHTTRPIRRGEVDGRDYHFVLSKEILERDIRNGLFVEAGVYNDHLYGMSSEAIRHVALQGKHCLLDVSTGAIPRLHAAGIYPIAILIKPRSPMLISLWNQPISEEAARKVYAATIKLFHDACQHFTAVVSADSPADVYANVKRIIEDHSQSLIWVNSNGKLP